MISQRLNVRLRLNIPQIDRVKRSRRQHIINIRIPMQAVAPVLVQVQGCLQIHLQVRITRDRPKLDLRVIATRCHDRLVELVVLDVRDGATMRMGCAVRVVAEGQSFLKVTVVDCAYTPTAGMVEGECDMVQTTTDQAAYCVRQAVCGDAIQNLL